MDLLTGQVVPFVVILLQVVEFFAAVSIAYVMVIDEVERMVVGAESADGGMIGYGVGIFEERDEAVAIELRRFGNSGQLH